MLTRTRQTRNGAAYLQPAISQIESLEGRLLFSTYTVTGLGDAAGLVTPAGVGKFNATTLRAALNAANAHVGADTIQFAAAVAGTINLGKALPAINDALTLAGPGATKLTVQRKAAATTDFSIFHINAGKSATISGLKIAKGTGDPHSDWTVENAAGGGIYNDGTLSITDCTLTGNSAYAYGGAIYSHGAVTVTRCNLTDNSAPGDGGGGGGIYNLAGSAQVIDSTISGNSVYSQGSGIYNGLSGKMTVTRSHVDKNDAAGGGIYNVGEITVTNSTISGNEGVGGVGVINDTGRIKLDGCTVSNNSEGGAFNTGTMTIAGCTFSGNTSVAFGRNGGAIHNYYGALTVTDSSFSNNSSNESAGGIYSEEGTLRVKNSTFTGNSAGGGGDGGAILQLRGGMDLENCIFIGNCAGYANGAIASLGSLKMTNCTVTGNSAESGAGAVAFSQGNALMINCNISNNTGGNSGGISLDGVLTMINCTVANNSVTGDGGAIYSDGTLIATNCTIVRNTAGRYFGGILNWGMGVLNLNNCIVAGNVQLGDPAIVDISNSPIGENTGSFIVTSSNNLVGGIAGTHNLINGKNGNKIGVTLAQLKLGPLADNGGPTQTMALLPGSIAINAGSNAKAIGPDGKPLTTDQRGTGYARIIGGRVDIGAFERQSATDATGSISGTVFVDLNGNRKQDPGEAGVKGRLVWVDLNRDGKLNFDEPRAVTNAGGQYVLTAVPTGPQLIRLEPQLGWKQTQPLGGGPNGPTLIAGLETKNWSFGVVPILGG